MIVRILIAVIILPFFVMLVFMENSLYYSLVVAMAASFGLYEFYGFFERRKVTPLSGWGILCGTLIACSPAPALARLYESLSLTSVEFKIFVSTVFMIGLLTVFLRGEVEAAIPNILVTSLGVFYIGYLSSYTILLKTLQDGSYFLFILFLFTWVYDGGAYFAGTWFGRHRLAPTISPKKTVEGVIGGLVACGLVFLILKKTIMPQLPITLTHGFILTILMGILGQLGDLCESMFKRYAEVKDSSRLLPEYGGILDKIDSLLFTAPLLYYYAVFILDMKIS